MSHFEFKISKENDGQTVKTFLRQNVGVSARIMRDLKYRGNISIENRKVTAHEMVCEGDLLKLYLPEESINYPAFETDISILYEDDNFLVVNKPYHMPVHPSPGHDCDSLLNAVAYHNKKMGQGYVFRPLYRLDRDTTGILIVAKNALAASCTQIDKTYVALCEGELAGTGIISLPIALKTDSKIVRCVRAGDGSQDACTYYRAVSFDGEITLVEIKLKTGRTHQIRVHFSHIGHPLCGDDLYGGNLDRIRRQALHCGEAKLKCPALSTYEHFIATIPPDMENAFHKEVQLNEFKWR